MKKDGGPAFHGRSAQVLIPSECTHAKQIEFDVSGMTLRQWYAGMAMQGLFSGIFSTGSGVKALSEAAGSEKLNQQEAIVKMAFGVADEMLRFEEKEAGEKE